MTRKRAILLLALFFCAMGIGCAVAGVCMLRYGDRVEAEYLPVTGRIERIDKYRNKRDETRYSVTVSYEVEGRAYVGKVNFYDSSMREGAPIDLKYDPANPADIDSPKMQFFFGWLLLGCGAFVLTVGMSLPWITGKLSEAPSLVVKTTVKR